MKKNKRKDSSEKIQAKEANGEYDKSVSKDGRELSEMFTCLPSIFFSLWDSQI